MPKLDRQAPWNDARYNLRERPTPTGDGWDHSDQAPHPGGFGPEVRRPLAAKALVQSMRMKLTPQQMSFVYNYIGVSNFNATDAYRRAFNTPQGINIHGHKLLGMPHIQAAIQTAMDARARKLELTPERILLEIMRVAFLDPVDLFDENGNLKKIIDIDPDARRALEGFDFEDTKHGTRKRIKMIDKLKALELLGRHLKLFKEEINIHLTYEQILLQSMELDEEPMKELETSFTVVEPANEEIESPPEKEVLEEAPPPEEEEPSDDAYDVREEE